jgi:chromosome segregation ATPase
MRNLEMMKAMCGFASYSNLVIATTMWSERSSLYEQREAQLLSDERFFGGLISRGATTFRHNEKGRLGSLEELTSARRIVTHLILQSEKKPPGVLELQREIIDLGKVIGETKAGIVLAGDLHKAHQAHQRELKKLKEAIEREVSRKDTEHAVEMQELKADLEKQMRKAEQDRRALQRSMRDLHKDEERAWRKRLKALEQRFLEDLAAKEQELRDMEESLAEIRKDTARRAKKSQKVARELEGYEQEVENVRGEVKEAHDTYQTLSGQKVNLFNGAANGIASGLATGIISGGKIPRYPYILFN